MAMAVSIAVLFSLICQLFAARAPSYPGSLINLDGWSLQLPIKSGKSVKHIELPELANYTSQYFRLNDRRTAISLVCNAGGAKTSGSNYPRTELRQWSRGDKKGDAVSWSTSSPHNMTFSGAINHTTTGRPYVVIAQVKGPSHYELEVMLRDGALGAWLIDKKGNSGFKKFHAAYRLGTRYTIRITANDGLVGVYLDDMTAPKQVFKFKCSECYFKVGNYLQSNTKYDAADATSEVWLYSLTVTP